MFSPYKHKYIKKTPMYLKSIISSDKIDGFFALIGKKKMNKFTYLFYKGSHMKKMCGIIA